MEFKEKAIKRIEHWVSHSEHHYEDYEDFAIELEKAGNVESAKYIREMMELASKTTECLNNALKSLEN